MICPKCKIEMIGVQYLDTGSKVIPKEHQYDGISEFFCTKCGYRVGRWSGRELKGNNDYERKFGLSY